MSNSTVVQMQDDDSRQLEENGKSIEYYMSRSKTGPNQRSREGKQRMQGKKQCAGKVEMRMHGAESLGGKESSASC